jgi:Na+(H+)/acetate symporter ActP
MFTFYLFQQPPMLFNRAYDQQVRSSARGTEYAQLEADFVRAFEGRRQAATRLVEARSRGERGEIEAAGQAFHAADDRVAAVRREAAGVVQAVTGDTGYSDVNYVFPSFVTGHMPVGLVGLIIAAIFAAAMSTIAAELNSLSTATVIDFYRRLIRTEASEAHYLSVSKAVTGFWGLVACVVALYAANLGPLIDVVNRFGSFFYGSLLGVFVLAVAIPRATARGAFVGLLAGMAAVAYVASTTSISFLWHNVVGVVAVVVVGVAVSLTGRPPSRA